VETTSDITAVIVNRRTPRLIRNCLRSLLSIYPDINIMLVDNKSQDRSTRYIRLAAALSDRIECVITTHTTHGPGLHAGILRCKTPYILTLDSDVTVLKRGFLELMLARFAANPKLFAVGNICRVNSSGVRPGPRRVVHPFCSLWDRRKYMKLKVRFEASGQPARGVCFAAVKAGYQLEKFEGDIRMRGKSKYIYHVWGGTRSSIRRKKR